MRLDAVRRDLRSEIDAQGYFPDLVEDTVTLALAGEDLLDFVVHHEPTFSHDQIHRHVTVLALTPTRLIVGHTDATGSDAYNQGLSERRARAAADYISRQGVAATRLRSLGRGETEPISTNDTAEGRSENRRVEIAIVASESARRR